MSNFKETDNFLNPRRDMKIAGKHKYIPVELTFETEEEFYLFWDGIERVLQNQDILLTADERTLFIEISNNFSCLK